MLSTEDLKEYFSSVQIPKQIKIAADMEVIDSDLFIQASFDAIQRWTKDLDKCPSYLRLLKLKEALESDTITA